MTPNMLHDKVWDIMYEPAKFLFNHSRVDDVIAAVLVEAAKLAVDHDCDYARRNNHCPCGSDLSDKILSLKKRLKT